MSKCLAQPSTRSRSAWTMAKMSTDVQAGVEKLLWMRRMASCKLSRLTSFDHCLHVFWHLRHYPCASRSRCARRTRFATLFSLCPARRSACTFTLLFLWRTILKYTAITNLFLRCHGHRASVGVNKTRMITAKQLEL